MPLCANKQPSDARSNSEAIKNYSLNTEHNKASNNNRGKVQPEEQGNEKLTGKAPPNLFFLALCILASRTIARCRQSMQRNYKCTLQCVGEVEKRVVGGGCGLDEAKTRTRVFRQEAAVE